MVLLSFFQGNNIITQLTRPAIRVIFYKFQRTGSGELQPAEHFDMAVQPSRTNLMLICPLVIEHKIDPSSPLYPISPTTLYNCGGNGSDAFEIVVIIEGTMESTGDACQYRTSYKPREILWGFRFKPTSYTLVDGRMKFNMTTFEEFEAVNMDGYIRQGKGPKLIALNLSNKIQRQARRKRKSIQENQSPRWINA